MARPVAIGSYETEVPVQEGMRRIIPEASGASIASGLQDLSVATQKVVQAQASAYAGSAVSRLRLGAEQSLLDGSSASSDDIEQAGGLTPFVMKGFKSAADQALQDAPNPLARKMVQQSINTLGADLQARTMRQDAANRVAQRSAGALDSAKVAATAVELNPDSWQSAASEQLSSIQGLGLDPQTTLSLSRSVDQQLSEAAGRGFAKQDPISTLNRMNDASDPLFAGMPLEQRSGLMQYARGQLVDQEATGLAQVFRDNGATAGTQALTALSKSTAIPVDLRDETVQRTNALVSQLREQSREQHVQTISQLEENVAKGQVTSGDRASAYRLYENNALDPSQLAGTLASIDRAQIKQAQDGVSLAAISAAYTNKTPLDPKDKDVQDATDQFFQGMTRGVTPGSAEYANRAAEVSVRTGIVPSSAVSWARANLTSGDAQSAAQAADLVSRLQEGNPRAAGFAVDDKTKAMADSISQAVQAGTAPQLAVDQARQNANLSKDDTKALDERWQAAVTGSTDKTAQAQSSALTTLLKTDPTFKPGFFSDVPSVPAAMQGEFDDLSKRYFELTGGNLQQARQLAARDLKSTWGVTEVNGKREIMEFAPEAMFPGLSPLVVRQDIEKTVGDNPQAFQRMSPTSGQLETVKPDPNTIRLIPTDRTARTNGLDWQLGAPDEFGAMDVLRGKDGTPLTYRLPVNATDFDAVRQRMSEAAIAKARELQKSRTQQEDVRAESGDMSGTGAPEPY